MIAFLKELLQTPEAQRDPHYWASVYGGHAYIALGPWGIIAIGLDMWTAAWLTPLLYFIVWEGAQWAILKKRTCPLLWDGILDTVSVAFACYAASLLGHGYQLASVWCWGASVGVMLTGVRVRS